jgi:DNA-binding Lrp family transcriptional regulator
MFENTADNSCNSLDVRLLNDFERNFPLCPAPFAELAVRLGVAEVAVLRRLEQLRREGKISRVGAVFAPKRIGASTLAAMAIPRERLALVADAVMRFPEVNHSDQREHHYNLWFVVTAGSEGRLQAALGAIAQAAGHPILQLPLLAEFRLDDAAGGQGVPVHAAAFSPPTLLDEIERRLVMALQEGLPLFIRPFAILASRVGCDEGEVLERIRRWCAQGVIKRFGVVLRDHDAGPGASALLVHDIPDTDLGRLGERLAGEPGVTLCYQRARGLPAWPYNLFCMIHGQLREEVLAKIADLRQRLGLSGYPHDSLFSLTRFKPTGAR